MPAVEGSVNINMGGGGGGIASGAVSGGGGLLSGLGGLGAVGKLVPIATAILGALGLIVSSSKMLQKTIGIIVKLIMLMIKPIGDILAVGLMPLIFMLKPLAQFFNILMKPYIKKAMAAMRAGGALLNAGDNEGAIEAFTIGAGFVLKPFFDMAVKASEFATVGILTLMNAMFDAVLPINIFKDAFNFAIASISSNANSLVETTSIVLDTGLGNVLARAQNVTGKSFIKMVSSLDSYETSVAFLTNTLDTTIETSLNNASLFVSDTWSPNFKKAIVDVFTELSVEVQDALRASIRKDVVESFYAGTASIGEVADVLQSGGI